MRDAAQNTGGGAGTGAGLGAGFPIGNAMAGAMTDAMKQSKGNYTAAAKLLGLHPNYLHRLVKNLNLKQHLK